MKIDTTQSLRQAIRTPYAWPGGYLTEIILSDGETICHDCAKKEYRQLSSALKEHSNNGWRPIALEINYENNDSYCCHCGKHMECAYNEN